MRRILLCVFFVLCALGCAAFSNVPDSIDIKWMVDGNLYSQSTCEYGGDVIVPNIPTKRGHTFIGWRRNYIELEYLESTGTQYIDTGVIPAGRRIGMEAIIQYVSWSESAPTIIGSGVKDHVDNCRLWGVHNNSWRIKLSGNNFYGTRPDFLPHVIRVNMPDGGGYLDGVKIYDIPQVTISNQNINSLYIFNDNGGGGSPAIARVFFLKLYDDTTLIQDMIPVLDPYGVPCMYDRVTNEFFYNQGTGQFIAGPVKS